MDVLIVLAVLASICEINFLTQYGQLIAARKMGAVITSSGMGTAHPFCIFRRKGIVFYYCWSKPLHLSTHLLFNDLSLQHNQKIIAKVMAGGILALSTFSFFTGAIWLVFPGTESVSGVLTVANATAALLNSIFLVSSYRSQSVAA